MIDASDVFRLNHYPIQSWEYFQKVKMGRGDANSSTADNVRDENYFKNYDKDTDFEDVDLQQMVLEQHKNLEKQKQSQHTSNLGLYVVIVLFLFSLGIFLSLFRSKPKRFKR
jgi:hypothetical protein